MSVSSDLDDPDVWEAQTKLFHTYLQVFFKPRPSKPEKTETEKKIQYFLQENFGGESKNYVWDDEFILDVSNIADDNMKNFLLTFVCAHVLREDFMRVSLFPFSEVSANDQEKAGTIEDEVAIYAKEENKFLISNKQKPNLDKILIAYRQNISTLFRKGEKRNIMQPRFFNSDLSDDKKIKFSVFMDTDDEESDDKKLYFVSNVGFDAGNFTSFGQMQTFFDDVFDQYSTTFLDLPPTKTLRPILASKQSFLSEAEVLRGFWELLH